MPSSRPAQIFLEFRFEASHQLSRPDWSDAQNVDVFGQCARLHGHSYRLRLALRGTIDPESGMVINFRDVKRWVRERVIDRLDHHHLNDVLPDLSTAENLAYWIAGQLDPPLNGTEIAAVEVWETATAGALLGPDELRALREQ